MLGLFGLVLETLGVAVILGSQAFFFWKARKEYGSLGTASLEIQAMRVYMNLEDVKETSRDKQKLKEALEKFPHAKLLYEDFRTSVVGLIVALFCLLCQLVS